MRVGLLRSIDTVMRNPLHGLDSLIGTRSFCCAVRIDLDHSWVQVVLRVVSTSSTGLAQVSLVVSFLILL
jgi:hypothetical protein